MEISNVNVNKTLKNSHGMLNELKNGTNLDKNRASIESRYGTLGYESAVKMQEKLGPEIQVVFNEKDGTFTLSGSKYLKIDDANKIIGGEYEGWKPEVMKGRNEDGELVVKFSQITNPDDPKSFSFIDNDGGLFSTGRTTSK